ncbi:hypothetical protein BE04_38005 [Sorangium cellulosum]|uniref:Uncharacterized protein n=1 Tax=Sorangium cellulosum TaxID=56 RepID=A0A150PVN6_SORCE|nr:hypothetical protein BE04_38005 [Sorangium cellulosum]
MLASLASIAAPVALSALGLARDLLRGAHQPLQALFLQVMASPVRTTVPILEAVVPVPGMAMGHRAIRSNCHAQLLPHGLKARIVPLRTADPEMIAGPRAG